MPRYWMISNRNVTPTGLGRDRGPLTYWVTDEPDVGNFDVWERRADEDFRRMVIDGSRQFPLLPHEQHEDQKHVTLFIHGYNSAWDGAARMYQTLADSLFSGDRSMGICVLFTWPSQGSPIEYLADRSDAEASAPDLAELLEVLYDWLSARERVLVRDPSACRAKTSLIAHSMGSFVLQKAMQVLWTRKNRPLLVSLLSQLLMVAADVDNDLFDSGSQVRDSDGDAIANLTYRVTALYTGLDEVLGVSAGLKHFGKRRLGRSGLDPTRPVPDNVWQVDCTPFFLGHAPPIHGAYFDTPGVADLMRDLLRGIDRDVLTRSLLGPDWPVRNASR